MIYINLHGGIGNQLFQYGYGLHLKNLTGDSLCLNTVFLPPNGYRLAGLGIDADCINRGKSIDYYLCLIRNKLKLKTKRIGGILFQTKRIMELTNADIESCSVYEGYWQGLMYVSDVVNDIQETIGDFKNRFSNSQCIELSEAMRHDTNSVMFHVRKGDYVTLKGAKKLYNSLSNQYYLDAINYLSIRFGDIQKYVFTNDPLWVKENIPCLSDGIIVTCDKYDFDTLLLMGSCKHSVVANSTLSWWGAVLKQEKSGVTIAPQKWFLDEDRNPHNLYKEEWIIL